MKLATVIAARMSLMSIAYLLDLMTVPESLEVGDERVQLGLACDVLRRRRRSRRRCRARRAGAQRPHLRRDVARHWPSVFGEPRVAGHVRLRHHVARVEQVHPMPVVAVAAADAREIRAGALAAPLERVVVDELAGHRVVAVALGLGAEGPDHLRVAVVAAFAHVDVAPGEVQRRVGLQAGDRLRSSSAGSRAARSRPARRRSRRGAPAR